MTEQCWADHLLSVMETARAAVEAEASARASHIPLIYCLNALISLVTATLGLLALWQLGRRMKS